jgi:hypothetical protein
VKSRHLVASHSAAKEWCADEGDTPSTSAHPTTIVAQQIRRISMPLTLFGAVVYTPL